MFPMHLHVRNENGCGPSLREYLSLCLVTASLAIVPAIYPGFGAETADVLRAIVGPQPVALLETASFKLQDQLNQFRSSIDGGKT